MGYILSDAATEDVKQIILRGAKMFGMQRARSYHINLKKTLSLLAVNPSLARERKEFNSPLRIYPFGSHIIIYAVNEDENIFIIRIRHAREDWENNTDK